MAGSARADGTKRPSSGYPAYAFAVATDYVTDPSQPAAFHGEGDELSQARVLSPPLSPTLPHSSPLSFPALSRSFTFTPPPSQARVLVRHEFWWNISHALLKRERVRRADVERVVEIERKSHARELELAFNALPEGETLEEYRRGITRELHSEIAEMRKTL